MKPTTLTKSECVRRARNLNQQAVSYRLDCASVASRPELATSDSHALEVQREHRIAELSARYGIST